MKFLVDTSVWSLALRRRKNSSHPQVEKLKTIIGQGEDVCLLGIVLMEVLQGLKERKQFETVRSALKPYPLLGPSDDDYVHAAAIRNECARKGIQASTIDFLVAGMAIRSSAFLLTADDDFKHMSRIIPLKLA
jgi:hypothetical protein